MIFAFLLLITRSLLSAGAVAPVVLEALPIYRIHIAQQENLQRYWNTLGSMNHGASAIYTGNHLALMVIFKTAEAALLASGIAHSELEALRNTRLKGDQEELEAIKEKSVRVEFAAEVERGVKDSKLNLYPAMEAYLSHFPESAKALAQFPLMIGVALLPSNAMVHLKQMVVALLALRQMRKDFIEMDKIKKVQKLLVESISLYAMSFAWDASKHQAEIYFKPLENVFRALNFPEDLAELKGFQKVWKQESWVKGPTLRILETFVRTLCNFGGFASILVGAYCLKNISVAESNYYLGAIASGIVYPSVFAYEYRDVLRRGKKPKAYRAWKQSNRFLTKWLKNKAVCESVLVTHSLEVNE